MGTFLTLSVHARIPESFASSALTIYYPIVAGEHLKKDGDENLIADTENAGKKKKKRVDKSDIEDVVHQSGTDSKNPEEKEKKKKRSDKNHNEAVHQSGTDSIGSEEKVKRTIMVFALELRKEIVKDLASYKLCILPCCRIMTRNARRKRKGKVS